MEETTLDSQNFLLIALSAKLLTNTSTPQMLLDLGAGTGRFSGRLHELGFEVIGLEPAESLRKIAQNNYPQIQFIAGSATSLPFPDNSFDAIVCVDVLEHIPNTSLAIQEMYRVLKPGGQAIIIDKNINSLHHLYFIPTRIWKFAKESLGRWMYTTKFPFKEKYFSPVELQKLLQEHFRSASWLPIIYVSDPKHRIFWKTWFWQLHQFVSQRLIKVFPRLSFYVLWQATK